MLSDHFFDTLNYHRHFNNPIYNILDVFINVNQLRNNPFHLHNPRHLNKYILEPLHLINLRHNNQFFHNLLNNLLSNNNLLNSSLHKHYFFDPNLNLCELISNIRHLLDYLFDLSVYNYSLFDTHNLERLRLYRILYHHLLDYCRHVHYFLYGFSHRY